MAGLTPLGDRVLIRRDETETQTESGIFIPDAGKEKPSRGEVVSIGDDVMNVNPRNKVLFGKYAGTEVQVNGEDLLIMREEEVIGILR